MKKLNLKINFNLSGIVKKTVWQKAVLTVILALSLALVLACGYLTVKPLSADIKKIIDDEISSVDINFDQKTIENIEKRQEPGTITETTSGKNPFASF